MALPYWAWAGFFWVSAAFIGGAFDGVAVDTTSHSALNTVLQMQIFNTSSRFVIWLPNTQFWSSLWDLMSLNFNLFNGDYQMFRWFFFICFALPIGIMVVQIMAPFMFSGLSFLRSVFTPGV